MPLSDKTKNDILDMIKQDMKAELDAAKAKEAAVKAARSGSASFYIKIPYIKNPYIKIPYLKL